jgi:microcystin degradation protein MlrC
MRRRRIAVGQLWQESHDFNPARTEASDFVVERGAELIARNRGASSTLGGLLRRLEAAGVELVPTLAARARPGGRVAGEVHRGFRDEIVATLRAAGPLDAIVFELHGAMTAEGCGSAELDVLEAIRGVVGAQVPISVGFDLHGHITPAILRTLDIGTACKTNPHADTAEAGEKAAELALALLDGRIRPVTAYAKLPMLPRGGWETTDEPMATLHRMAREAIAAAAGRLLDVSIFNVHPYRDMPEMGQAIIAIADGDAALAERTVATIARAMWQWRECFMDDFASIDRALDQVAARDPALPLVLSDMGDRVLAGAPGDSTAILRRVRERGLAIRGAHPVTDPVSAARAIAAGVGATLRLELGGAITPGFAPLPIEGRVLHVSDGDFVQKGPYQGGQRSTLGPSAVLDCDGQTVLVTTAAGMTQDPAAFTSQGIDIAAHDFVVAKSGNHFKISFAGVAVPLVVDTPGMSTHDFGFFPYTLTKFWPLHDLRLDGVPIEFFGRDAPAAARAAL